MHGVLETLQRTRVVAVVRLEGYDQAVEVIRALVAGGITVIEFTHTGTAVDDAETCQGFQQHWNRK